MKSIKGTVAEQMESSVLCQSFLRDFNSHFLFCGQIENKSNFLPDQTVQTRKNSIKNKSCYLIWTYRKSVISDAQKIGKIWAKDA